MQVSENTLKWALRCYPPLLLQRIWVVNFGKGFKSVKVLIKKSFLNRNYNNSIFGGTIFAAGDPFYPVLFMQIFTKKGYKVIGWSKASEIRYLKPGFTDLHFEISVEEAEIKEAEQMLNEVGKYVKVHHIDIFNTKGEVCASIRNEIYIGNLDFKE